MPQIQMIKQAGKQAPARKKRVAAYCRVSTDMETQQSSLSAQVNSFRSMISARPDWELADIYADDGISGTQAFRRTAFQRMLKDCDEGKIDYIITKSISRFARNTLECLAYVRQLKEKGIYIIFEKENINTENDASEMVLSVLAAFAQEESRSLSENMKWGLRKRCAVGEARWTEVYGYTRANGEEYVVDEPRAAVVRRIFREYMVGRSIPAICDGLMADNIPSPSGADKWFPKTVGLILGNEKYKGDLRLQKSYTVSHITHQKIKNDGAVPVYYVKNHHTPIVDEKTFDLVQTVRSLKDSHKGATQYPYYGFLICPLCGQSLVRHTLAGVHGRPAVWHCMDKDQNDLCGRYFIREEYIDQAFKQAYEDDISTVEYYILDKYVEKITFSGWTTMTVHWKTGLKTDTSIAYKQKSHIPASPEQLNSGSSRRWSEYTEESSSRVPDPNVHRRLCCFGNDTIVRAAFEQVDSDKRLRRVANMTAPVNGRGERTDRHADNQNSRT